MSFIFCSLNFKAVQAANSASLTKKPAVKISINTSKLGKAANKIAKVANSKKAGGAHSGTDLISSNDSSYYNQQDYPNVNISGASLSEIGCLVTSIAMAATIDGHRIDPPGVVNASTFSNGYWLGFTRDIGIHVGQTEPINWTTVDNQLKLGHPVIAGVRVSGPLYDGYFNHFIVIKGISRGKYLIEDPYWRSSSYSIGDVKAMKLVYKE